MIVLADIGGSRTRVAVSDGTTFEEPQVFDTTQDLSAECSKLQKAVDTLLAGRSAHTAVIGVAGTLSSDKQTLLRAPHLSLWEGQPIASRLKEALGMSVHMENDAALGALGEAVAGAGRDASIMAYVTVGTGVGGARIVRKRIDTTTLGFEIGHQYLVVGETAREVEQLVSGAALEARHHTHPKEITDPSVWEETARVFTYALFNTIVHWSPDTVVLGGSMFNMPGINIESVKLHLKEIGAAYPMLPIIKKAELGTVGGLHGALAHLSVLRSS